MAGSKSMVKMIRKDVAKLEARNAELDAEKNINNEMIELYNTTLAKIAPEVPATNEQVEENVPA